MLLAAVLASMSTEAYAVNPTGSIEVDAGATETVTSIGTSGSASYITKLGEGTAVLDSSLTTVNSTIRVMEGTLKIGDADAVSPSTVAIRTNYDTYYEVLTVGAERQYVSGRSLGVAFGYDWGKVSPFSTSRVDQNSWHAALYGRAGDWKVGQKGSVALDWSAAVGNTTSEHSQLGSDWSQDSMQLDARATYSYSLNDRTAVSAFASVQYYAQGDASTARVKADSLQNLRLQAGAGIS